MSVVGIDYCCSMCCICFMLQQYGVSWCSLQLVNNIYNLTLMDVQDTPAWRKTHLSVWHYTPLQTPHSPLHTTAQTNWVVLYFSSERAPPAPLVRPPTLLSNNGLIKVRPCRVKWFRCVHTSIQSAQAYSLQQGSHNLYSELAIFREIITNKVLVSQPSQYTLQLVRLLEWWWSWWWF